MPERSGVMHVNEGVTNGIYFMYNYFLEKIGQTQNERKNCMCEKAVLIAIFIFLVFFSSFLLFIYKKKDGQKIFTKKKFQESHQRPRIHRWVETNQGEDQKKEEKGGDEH